MGWLRQSIWCKVFGPQSVLNKVLATGVTIIIIITAAIAMLVLLFLLPMLLPLWRATSQECQFFTEWKLSDVHLQGALGSSLFPDAELLKGRWAMGLHMEAGSQGTGCFEFPGRQAQLGPGRDLPWGQQSRNHSQPLCFTFLPQHKREGWVTPQTTWESLTTIFNFKQATHKSWRLLLQTQPLGNHCLADINSPVTVKLLLKMQLFYSKPFNISIWGWAMGSTSRSGPALIPKLSMGGNSTGNVGPAVRVGEGEGQFEII